MPDAPANLFVTGCYRSGTTLLEKLLHHHPALSVAPQPFPVFYFHVKSAFDSAYGLRQRYPLEHRFCQNHYQAADFYRFLDEFELSRADLDHIFQDLSAYGPGCGTPQMLDLQHRFSPGTFTDVFRQLNERIAEIFPKQALRAVGSKEIVCEEYIPYLLKQGVKTIVIVRDPRDVVLSSTFNQRGSFTGKRRPVLYSLRIWRKSVAVALANEADENFCWMRYEDLVHDPLACLNRIAEFLRVEAFSPECFAAGLTDQWGTPWKGNSSFSDQLAVSGDSVGRYENALADDVVEYIEACCYPEMQALQYAPSRLRGFEASAIERYRDPFDVEHGKFGADYSSSAEHVGQEVERYRKLAEQPDMTPEDAAAWFIDPRVVARLRDAIASTLVSESFSCIAERSGLR